MNLINRLINLSVIIHIILILIVSSLGFYLVYDNFIDEKVTLNQALLDKQTELEVQYRKAIATYKAIPVYEQRQTELKMLNIELYKYVPESNNISNLLVNINQVAEDTGVSIISFQPGAIVSYSPLINYQEVKVKVTCNYAGLMNFMTKLLRAKYFISVDNLQLSGNASILSASFDLKEYFSTSI